MSDNMWNQLLMDNVAHIN